MASETDICNMALARIRGGFINSLGEDSAQGKACRLYYGTTRDKVLEDAPWGFAKQVRQLDRLSSVDLFGWAYAYEYPTDALRVNEVLPEYSKVQAGDANAVQLAFDRGLTLDLDQKIEYEIMNNNGVRVIGANMDTLYVSYNISVKDSAFFTNNFVTGLSLLLAANLVVHVIGADRGEGMRRNILQEYAVFISQAEALELNQRHKNRKESRLEKARR